MSNHAKIKGTNRNDNLIGTIGADDIVAKKANDIVNAMGGDDDIDGGDGNDTAVFSGSVSDYSFQWLADGFFQVSGPDGVDRLTGIEFLQFGSETYSIPSGVTFTRVTGGGENPPPEGDSFPTGGLSDDGSIVFFTEINPSGIGKSFIYDRQHGTIEQLPGTTDDSVPTAISGNGRFLAYLKIVDPNTFAENIIYDRKTGALTNITQGADSSSEITSLSDNGRIAALFSYASNLAPDSNPSNSDILIYDQSTKTFENITNGGDSDSLDPNVSGDGNTVAFWSYATNLVPNETDLNGVTDIFVFDRTTGVMDNITHGANGPSVGTALSSDGSIVIFESSATNLVPGEVDANGTTGDIFAFDRTTGVMDNITQGANVGSFSASISDDGRYVAFSSGATNLVPNALDLNGDVIDVFVYDRLTGTMTNVIAGNNGRTFDWGISGDGSTVAFSTTATNLVPGNYNGFINVMTAELVA